MTIKGQSAPAELPRAIATTLPASQRPPRIIQSLKQEPPDEMLVVPPPPLRTIGQVTPSMRMDLDRRAAAVASPLRGSIDVSIILGTVNRPELLRQCIQAVRSSIGKELSYEIVVAYGQDNEPALPWLREQPDIVLVLGGMQGAIPAFNRAYDASRGLTICQINDDVLVDGDSIARAVGHLHTNPDCAAVVFQFDRGDGRGYRHEKLAEGKLHPNQMVARRSTCEAVIAHIGAFWGDEAHRTDKTYGGDSAFGVLCHHLGLRLDSVRGVSCRDREHADALRERNSKSANPQHGARWRAMYDRLLQTRAKPPQPDRTRAARIHATDPVEGRFPAHVQPQRERVLHLHLATPDDPQAGLVRALKGLGDYAQIDWQQARARGSLERDMLGIANRLRPTLVFMQLQTPDVVGPETIAKLRPLMAPKGVIATWCGDVANKNSPWTVDWQVPLGRVIDLVLHTSLTHVKALRAAGIPGAAYCQIGYDPIQYQPAPGVEKPHDVCFLGNRYYSAEYLRTMKQHDAPLRDAVIEAMAHSFGKRFALYGSGHNGGLGQMPLSRAHEAYQRSKIGLNVSLSNTLEAYSSDRIFRILGCGALLLTKRFPLMGTYGLRARENCLVWDTPAEAVQLARAYLEPSREAQRTAIAEAGAELAKTKHTWDYRMGELAALLQAVRGK